VSWLRSSGHLVNQPHYVNFITSFPGLAIHTSLEPTMDVTQTVGHFIDEFNVAFMGQDVDFLFDNLVQIEVLATHPSGTWTFERDGHSIDQIWDDLDLACCAIYGDYLTVFRH